MIVLLMWLLACQAPEPEPEIIRPVRTVTVQGSGGAVTRSFTGSARAGEEARLSFKVAGLVRKVHVKVGDRVQAGDLIAELDSVDYQLQVQQLDAAQAQAQAQARNATSTYERVRELYIADNASRADLDTARAASESAKAAVSSVRQQRALAVQQLGYAKLTATREGAVAEVRVNANENVSPGMPVVLLTSGAKPEVLVGIPATLIQRVQTGLQVTLKISALGGRAFGGTVTEVGVASSAATTFPVTVRLDESTEEVRPGMPAEVVFSFAPVDDRVHPRVPPVAVGEDRDGRYVWLVDTSDDGLGTTRKQAVSIGELTSDGLDITEGLNEGDRVVTAGVSRIQGGQVVRLDVP